MREVTITGKFGSATGPLNAFPKETLIKMLTGEIEWHWADEV